MKMNLVRSAVIASAIAVFLGTGLSGCTKPVTQGRIGRISTASGWQKDILRTGEHSCWGRDQMYMVDVTNKSFREKIEILVGGKVNLTVNLEVRAHANDQNDAMMRKVFENVQSDVKSNANADRKDVISVDQMYNTYIRMNALSIPRSVYEVQPDVQTAIANSPALANEVRRRIIEVAKSTPLVVDDVQITNYDWPDSITKAQENLVTIQLKEAAAAAQVRADLEKAKGDLRVEEAKKLVAFKQAEAIAGSIDIIKKRLAGSPEYLMWHQIEVMGKAAAGPNNAFILYPYNTDASQMKGLLNNAHLNQVQKSK